MHSATTEPAKYQIYRGIRLIQSRGSFVPA